MDLGPWQHRLRAWVCVQLLQFFLRRGVESHTGSFAASPAVRVQTWNGLLCIVGCRGGLLRDLCGCTAAYLRQVARLPADLADMQVMLALCRSVAVGTTSSASLMVPLLLSAVLLQMPVEAAPVASDGRDVGRMTHAPLPSAFVVLTFR